MTAATSNSNRRFAAFALIIGAILFLAAGGYGLMLFLSNTPEQADAEPIKPTQAAVSQRSAEVKAAIDQARNLIANMQTTQAEQFLRDTVAKYQIDQELRLLFAQVLQEQGNPAEALAQYEAAITIGPDHAEYRFAAGLLSDELGHIEDAEAHLRAAQSLDLSNPKFPLYLAAIETKLGKRDQAREAYTRAAKLDDSLAIALGGLAQIALDENHAESALERARKARNLEPERVAWRVLEARALRRLSKPAEAVQVLYGIPEAARLRDGVVLTEIATALAMMQRAPEADAIFDQAVNANPRDAGVHAAAASWYLRYSNLEAAEAHARQAKALGSSEADDILAHIAKARAAQNKPGQ